MNDKCELIDCGYYGTLHSLKSIIEYIDAQEPHVLTYDELIDESEYSDGAYVTSKERPVWIEYKGGQLDAVIIAYTHYLQEDITTSINFISDGAYTWYNESFVEYNRKWRLWSAKPTNEKRKETKWHE